MNRIQTLGHTALVTLVVGTSLAVQGFALALITVWAVASGDQTLAGGHLSASQPRLA